MALKSNIYQELESTVGTENISEDPEILDSYAFQIFRDLLPLQKGEKFGFRPEAVLLPGSTEEVQAIVKICNKHRIRFKALSTGWGIWGGPGSEGVIQLDLRRMNRILEINEKNMYAVVEPYVICAQLQAELMKRGLNCQIIMGGANVSALPLTNLSGDGYSSVSTSIVGRNTLGVEWVLPTGEILRLGSLGSGGGWFCGDGPGPSLRSLIRGIGASEGGIGVFTKAATKVYHWPGPPVPPTAIEGTSPHYAMKSLSGVHIYYATFPSWEKLVAAGTKIAESEIAYELGSIPDCYLAADIATNNEEFNLLYNDILKRTKGKPAALVTLVANSRREFEYQEKVLMEILRENQGECFSLLEEDNIQGPIAWRFIRMSSTMRQVFRPTGGTVGFTAFYNWNILPGIRGHVNKEAAIDYIKKGLLFDDLGDGGYNTSIEYGHLAMNALGCLYDPTDPDSRQAATEVINNYNRLGLNNYKYIVPAMMSAAHHEIIGPLQGNYQHWQRKIKKAFDPSVVSDPGYYIEP